MTIEQIEGRRTPTLKASLLPGDDESGDERIAALRKDTSDSLAGWNNERPTFADMRPPKPFRRPQDRRQPRGVDPSSHWAERLTQAVQPHHDLLASKAVDGARGELLAKVEAAQVAADAVLSVEAERKAEQASRTESARADAATSSPAVALPVATDWEATKAARLAIFNDAHGAAAKAANVYRSTVASEAPRRIDAVLTTAEGRRAKALSAVRSIEADVQAAVEAAEAVKAFESEFGLSGTHGWHRFTDDERAMHRRAARALDGIRTYLDRTDDAATGRWILDESPSLPMHSRAALAEASGGTRDRWILAQAELDDELNGRPALSDTRDPDDEHDSLFAREHLAKRSLPR